MKNKNENIFQNVEQKKNLFFMKNKNENIFQRTFSKNVLHEEQNW